MSRDIVAYVVLVLTVIFGYYQLVNYSDTDAYIRFDIFWKMLAGGWIALIVVKSWYGLPNDWFPIDYDNNLTRTCLIWIGIDVAGITILSTLASQFAPASSQQLLSLAGLPILSFFYVPNFGDVTFLSNQLLTEFLRQLCIVCHAEEVLKLGAAMALTYAFSHVKASNFLTKFLHDHSLAIGAGIPIGLWSYYHSIQAVSADAVYMAIPFIFASGVLLFVSLIGTKELPSGCLLVPIIAHSIWNFMIFALSI